MTKLSKPAVPRKTDREPFARVSFWGGYAVNPERIVFKNPAGAQRSAEVLRTLIKARQGG